MCSQLQLAYFFLIYPAIPSLLTTYFEDVWFTEYKCYTMWLWNIDNSEEICSKFIKLNCEIMHWGFKGKIHSVVSRVFTSVFGHTTLEKKKQEALQNKTNKKPQTPKGDTWPVGVAQHWSKFYCHELPDWLFRAGNRSGKSSVGTLSSVNRLPLPSPGRHFQLLAVANSVGTEKPTMWSPGEDNRCYWLTLLTDP